MQATRQLLLEALQTKRRATAADLARWLQVSKADIRYHLGELSRSGLVKTVGMQKVPLRGRPQQIYTLANEQTPNNFELLAETLLYNLPVSEADLILRNVAHCLAQEVDDWPKQLTARLGWAVSQLNNLNYQARWEAYATFPRILFHHCPYFSILPNHPQLCKMDIYLLEILCDHSVRLVSNLLIPPTADRCIFAVE